LDVAKIAVFSFLSSQVKETTKAYYARQFCLSQWITEEIENSKKVSLYMELWNKNPEDFK
jgi:hypothetical protein